MYKILIIYISCISITLSVAQEKDTLQLLPIKSQGKYGYIDLKGKIVIAPQFDFVGEFSKEGFAIAQKNKQLGFIDKEGKTVIPFDFKDIRSLGFGMFAVKKQNWGVMNVEGKVLLKNQYESIKTLTETQNGQITRYLILFQDKNKWGAINSGGMVISPARYDSLQFADRNFILTLNNQKKGLLSAFQGEILAPEFDAINLSDSLLFWVEKQKLVGCYDLRGTKLLDCEYLKIERLKNSPSFLMLHQPTGKGLYSFQQRKIIIPTEFDAIYFLSDNTETNQFFLVNQKSKKAIFDRAGSEVLPLGIYTFIRYATKDVFFIVQKQKWGLAGRGKILISPQFDEISKFNKNIAMVKKGELFGLINIWGEIIVPPIYALKAIRFTGNSIKLTKNNGLDYLTLDNQGRVLDRISFQRQIKTLSIRKGKDKKQEDEVVWDFQAVKPSENLISEPVVSAQQNTVRSQPQPINLSSEIIGKGNFQWFKVDSLNAWGMMDATRKVIQAPIYLQVELYDSLQLAIAIRREDKGDLFDNQTGRKILGNRTLQSIRQIVTDFKYGKLAYLGFLKNKNAYLQRDGRYLRRLSYSDENGKKKSGRILNYEPFTKEHALVKVETQFTKKPEKIGKWGLIDRNGKWIVFPHYEAFNAFKNGLAIVKKTKKWGVINQSNQAIVPFEFKEIKESDNIGVYSIRKGRKWGLMNLKGKMLIAPIFDNIGAFDEDGLTRILEKGKWGLMDSTGKIMIKPQFEQITEFNQFDVAGVQKNNQWGLIDKKGNLLTDKYYDNIQRFDEAGFAIIRKLEIENNLKIWKKGILFKSGKEIIAPRYDSVAYLPNTANQYFWISNQNTKYGYLNEKGGLEIPFQFDKAQPFQEERAAILNNGKWGFIDLKGNVVVKTEYSKVQNFKEGRAVVMNRGKYGFVDKSGNQIVPINLQLAKDFENGLALIKKDNKLGIINLKGDLCLPVEYDDIGEFNQYGFALVRKGQKKEALFGFINRNGKEILPCQYQQISNFQHGTAKVKQNNQFNLIDSTANLLLKDFYESLEHFYEGLALAEKDKLFGYIDTQGKVQIPMQFNTATSFFEGFARVSQGKDLFYINTKGEKIETLPDSMGWVNRDVYQQLRPISNDMYAVEISYGRWGFLNANGKIQIQAQYKTVTDFQNGFAKVKDLKGSSYFIDKRGIRFNTLPFGVEWIEEDQPNERQVMLNSPTEETHKTVKVDGKIGITNQYGFYVVRPKYDFLSAYTYQVAPAKHEAWYGIYDTEGNCVIDAVNDEIHYLGNRLFLIERQDYLAYWSSDSGWIWKFE